MTGDIEWCTKALKDTSHPARHRRGAFQPVPHQHELIRAHAGDSQRFAYVVTWGEQLPIAWPLFDSMLTAAWTNTP